MFEKFAFGSGEDGVHRVFCLCGWEDRALQECNPSAHVRPCIAGKHCPESLSQERLGLFVLQCLPLQSRHKAKNSIVRTSPGSLIGTDHRPSIFWCCAFIGAHTRGPERSRLICLMPGLVLLILGSIFRWDQWGYRRCDRAPEPAWFSLVGGSVLV